MKRRLLSLLLVMAMLLSMVPFQAFAEEVDEAPALLEETEEIVSEITEETIPETTEETVPETTEETVPETTVETVPETTVETVPETTEEAVPETTEETVPETTEETVPETTEETVPETTEELIPEEAALILDGSDEVAPEGNGPSFHITFPSSARKVEGMPVLTAGQKLNLSTDLSKADAKKGVEWKIVFGFAIDPREASPASLEALSLDDIRPEGAAVDGGEWNAIASIDSKGVLRTNAAVTRDNYVIFVAAFSNDTALGLGYLPVLIQPPVESFWVDIDSYYGNQASPSEEESADSAVNRKDDWPWRREIGRGPFEIYADGFLPQAPADGVKWSVKVSKNVADWEETEDNTIIVYPKAPGKLTFTATSKDGSGAKYSGIVEIYGYVRDLRISTPEDYNGDALHPGDTLKLTAAAYYDRNGNYPISGGKYSWYVHDREGNGHDFATIDKNGKLTITDKVTRPTTLYVECYYETKIGGYYDSNDAYINTIKVAPSNDGTLALAAKYGDPDYPWHEIIHTAFPWHGAPGEWVEIVPVWVDKRGEVTAEVPVEDVRYKVSGNACSFDQTTGVLTFNKVGTTKITATATLDGKTQNFTCTFQGTYFTDSIKIQNKPGADGCITVIGGKSLSLKAINYSGDKKATDQSVSWEIDEDAFDDEYDDFVDDYCWIDWSTGKLTTYPVDEDYYVTVTAQPADLFMGGWENRPTDTIRIHIIPEKTQYRSYAHVDWYKDYFYLNGDDRTLELGVDFRYRVESYGRRADSCVTDVISSNPKIAEVVKENGVVTGIRIPADAKPGKVTITVKGQVMVGEDEWIDAPSAKFTLNVVKPVTSIEITRPTNKDDSFVPAYVGKSLKLTAKVNSDATNKKLHWNVAYYNGDPEGEFDWDEDWDKLEWLDDYDKTTVQNGVLKIDKSWYTHGRCYAVWAWSEDGYAESDPIFIQAYGMTGSIDIWSAGEYDPDTSGYEFLDKMNNRTITIMPGEEVQFAALVYDVTGSIIDCYQEDIYDEDTGEIIDTILRWDNHGANPDVKWTISGNKGGIIESEEHMEYYDYGEVTDVLYVTGKNPGTVTIKATAKDGSKKTATFKLVVEEVKQVEMIFPDCPPELLYKIGMTNNVPDVAFRNLKTGEIVNAAATDVEWSCSDKNVTFKRVGTDTDNPVWMVTVSPEANPGSVTFTVKDVRKGISGSLRANPCNLSVELYRSQQ